MVSEAIDGVGQDIRIICLGDGGRWEVGGRR